MANSDHPTRDAGIGAQTPPKLEQPTSGGGINKVLHTLRMAQRSGLGRTSKALLADNTCKACGLGMGGLRGGMTNELDEFPSVCNKSVQAQSSDLQPAIPTEIFSHSIEQLSELSEADMNSLGRLTTPLMKQPGDTHLRPISWDEAIGSAASWFKSTTADRSFFYSSGRSSNEAGFLLQLFARLYGTNNVNNCSYYCHQATSVALENSIGRGTATVELADLGKSDCIFVVGANPASNHPRFIYQLQAVRARGGEVIVINPAEETGLVKFAMPKSPKSLIAGGSEIASLYLQPNIGTDTILLQGLAKAVLDLNAQDDNFIQQFTQGFGALREQLDALSYAEVIQITGINQAQLEAVAQRYSRAKHAVFAWGMGLTHQTVGVNNIEQLTNLALLRGMIGRPGAGLLPLRGHSNVQGIGTIGVKPVLAESVIQAIEQTLDVALPKQPGLDTMAALQAAFNREIDLAFVLGGNLYAASPKTDWAEAALNKIRHKIFLTTTLNRGHVHGIEGAALILPVTPRDEEEQATTQESMFNYVRLSAGGIVRHQNIRPESAVICELASQVVDADTFDFQRFADHHNVRKAIAATVPGMERLEDIDVAQREFHVKNRLMHTPEFATADGKGHFHTLPTNAAVKSTAAAAQTDELFPYRLATIRSEGQFNSIVYEQEDTYRGVPERWVVLMGPSDLARLNLAPGDKVSVRSNFGLMEGVTVYQHNLPPGNLMAYYPEANVLVGTSVDPQSRTPAFKCTAVNITRYPNTAGTPLAAPGTDET